MGEDKQVVKLAAESGGSLLFGRIRNLFNISIISTSVKYLLNNKTRREDVHCAVSCAINCMLSLRS